MDEMVKLELTPSQFEVLKDRIGVAYDAVVKAVDQRPKGMSAEDALQEEMGVSLEWAIDVMSLHELVTR
jgi:hypothetical protein